MLLEMLLYLDLRGWELGDGHLVKPVSQRQTEGLQKLLIAPWLMFVVLFHVCLCLLTKQEFFD